MRLGFVWGLFCGSLLLSGWAQAEGAAEANLLEQLNFQTGVITLPEGLATLNMPEKFAYLNPADTRRVLVDLWGNPPSSGSTSLGMVVPSDIPLSDAASWAAIIEFDPSGYVSDEDAGEINYADLLKSMKEDNAQENKQRVAQGYDTVELIGWAESPRYDRQGRKLYWAKELAFAGEPEHYLNYNILALGRKGVLSFNFVGSMDQLAQINRAAPDVLAMTAFNPGQRYEDFNPELDKVAAYGLGALIAGKLAAKAGFFVLLLALLKKFWLVPVLLLGWLGKRLFSRG